MVYWGIAGLHLKSVPYNFLSGGSFDVSGASRERDLAMLPHPRLYMQPSVVSNREHSGSPSKLTPEESLAMLM